MTYNEMLTIIDFNVQNPWDFDFYIYRGTERMEEQEFCDFAYPKITFSQEGVPFSFHRRFKDVYFYIPKGSTVDTESLGVVEQVTDIPTEPVVPSEEPQ
jgi:hypothetical protein